MCSVLLTYGPWALLVSPAFWVVAVIGRAGLFALPPSLPIAPIQSVLNPRRDGFEVSSLAVRLILALSLVRWCIHVHGTSVSQVLFLFII